MTAPQSQAHLFRGRLFKQLPATCSSWELSSVQMEYLMADLSSCQAPDPQGAVVAETAASHEDLGQVQGEL